MYYAHPSSGERFYLHLLLIAVEGATSYRHLHTVLVNSQHKECVTFCEACLKLGLLENDNEWIQCLEEAGEMATSWQLHNLFVTILCENAPSDPLTLWIQFCVKICDDLHHALHNNNIHCDPTEEHVFDYGLYLINHRLCTTNKSLADWPTMPQPQGNWDALIGNQLIAEQHNYDMAQEEQYAAQRIPCWPAFSL